VTPSEKELLAELIALSLEDTASASQLEQLRSLLASDEQALAMYTKQLALHGLLTWVHEEQSSPSALATERLKRDSGNPPAGSSSELHRFLNWRTWLTLAATLAVVGASSMFFLPRRAAVEPQPPEPIARLVESDCTWQNPQSAVVPGTLLVAGQAIQIASGVAEVMFETGATVLIKGPAHLRLESASRAHLVAGKITADVPDAAVGFVITTATARVVDYGTRFGVGVDESSATDMIVFDGLIEAEATSSPGNVPPSSTNTSQSSRRIVLTAGHAARTSPDQRTMLTVDPILEHWPRKRSMPLVPGVRNISGDIQVVTDPPKTIEVNGWEHPDHVRLLTERQQVVLPRDLRIGFSGPGEFVAYHQDLRIPKGTTLDSYLLHFDPPKGERRTRTGTLQFDDPVLAIVTGSVGFRLKDPFFALPEIEYIRSREERIDFGQDQLRISEDRRTVTFVLESAGDIDQFRILVASESQASP
jgi:hypothetical protein